MLFYFILFCIIGLVIGFVIKNPQIGLAIIVVITVGWAFVYGSWALTAFIELLVGYAVARVILKEISK